MKYCIRVAEDKDNESLLYLMKEHARFEGHKLEYCEQNKQLTSLETLPVTIFVVESNNNLLGYMSVIKQFSTWDMDWYLYLDCLYLTEGTRGQGIGMKLMQKLKCFAKENMLAEIQWQTPKDNFLAIEFYQKLNTDNKGKQRFYWAI
ncbi:MAG: GNAT family N-acetyltransferase [Oceanospirillaceae bacterium]